MLLMGTFLMFLSFLLILLSFMLLINSTFISIELIIFNIPFISIPLNIIMDWPSMMFMATVLLISASILIFSMDYIPSIEHSKFSMTLLMFILSMLLLIMSDNIIFMLLGWDGLGLSSFILVIYYQNFSSSASGAITIFSNRLGDTFILLSIAFLFSSTSWDFLSNESFPKIALLFMTLAAFSKSAQFPFSAWLPAAMAAPTPVSALVHSSTLVTAGVYILIRILNNPHPTPMIIIVVTSSLTALYASFSANWEMDMKKIIALSTLSQIAIMMFAISMGAITLAFFHLIIHAMFKSLMFLCAGTLIHSSSYQDMRSIPPLLHKNPITSTILGISSLALMGIPFTSGFFSKDPIVELYIFSNMVSSLSSLMILSIGLTSAYSIRMLNISLKFFLKSKPDTIFHPLTYLELSLLILAPMSIFLGSLFTWLSCPEQLIIIPFYMKLNILLFLLLGLILGVSLNYYSKSYKKCGQMSISIWFLHFITTALSTPSHLMASFNQKNDKNWQETYGPYGLWNHSSYFSRYPNTISSQLLFLILMISLFPIISIFY